jgi:hypothetical protein
LKRGPVDVALDYAAGEYRAIGDRENTARGVLGAGIPCHEGIGAIKMTQRVIWARGCGCRYR